MKYDQPLFDLIKNAGYELFKANNSPFTRQDIIHKLKSRYPDINKDSINPIIQAMTINLKGGPGVPEGDVFKSVGRGKYILYSGSSNVYQPIAEPRRKPNRQQGSNSIESREQKLRNKLNNFLIKRLKLPVSDYYEKMDLDDLLDLKSALSSINNIFTLKVSIAFISWIGKKFELSEDDLVKIKSEILNTNPNANGYDIQIGEPLKLIAEVKCNVPVRGGNIYGSAQRNGIKKDIEGLIFGKSKSKIQPDEYLKFMVFLDRPEIREANYFFLKNYETTYSLEQVNHSTEIKSTDSIYSLNINL